MSLLLDTHAAIWWWCAPDRLSRGVLEQMKDPETTVLFSAASAFEIALKRRLGKLPLPPAIADHLEERVVEEGWELLSISVRHARLAGAWEIPHRDPFDRLLAAQTQLEKLDLVTTDPAFAVFGISCIW